jgi:outer membrane immunogenic protein
MPKGKNVKKVLLTTTALIALGIAPAAAADLAARPYTKAPPMAVAYNWSGFYAGFNVAGDRAAIAGRDQPRHRFSGSRHDRRYPSWSGRLLLAAGTWVFGVEAQGNWADFHGSNVSRLLQVHQRHACRCLLTVHWSGRLRRNNVCSTSSGVPR